MKAPVIAGISIKKAVGLLILLVAAFQIVQVSNFYITKMLERREIANEREAMDKFIKKEREALKNLWSGKVSNKEK